MNTRPEATHTDLYHRAPCGLATIDRRGTFLAINQTLLEWLGLADPSELPRFQDLLAAGDRIYWETHATPLLDMQGDIAEIAVELITLGGTAPVLLNAMSAHPGRSETRIDLAIFPAEDRRKYERELLTARKLAEASEAKTRELAQSL
ncbi:MAG: phosphatase, partial [Acidimicrobiia bacterium]